MHEYQGIWLDKFKPIIIKHFLKVKHGVRGQLNNWEKIQYNEKVQIKLINII